MDIKELTWEQVLSIPLTWENVIEWRITWENVQDFVLRKDEILVSAESQAVLIQIDTSAMDNFDGTSLILEYDPTMLQLMDAGFQTAYRLPRYDSFTVTSEVPGKVAFRCEKQTDGYWSGFNTLLYFQSLQLGDTTIQLSY